MSWLPVLGRCVKSQRRINVPPSAGLVTRRVNQQRVCGRGSRSGRSGWLIATDVRVFVEAIVDFVQGQGPLMRSAWGYDRPPAPSMRPSFDECTPAEDLDSASASARPFSSAHLSLRSSRLAAARSSDNCGVSPITMNTGGTAPGKVIDITRRPLCASKSSAACSSRCSNRIPSPVWVRVPSFMSAISLEGY